MKKLLSISAIIGVMIVAVITSLLVLDIISVYETREILFKAVGVIGIFTIASVLILLITGMEHDDKQQNQEKHENKDKQ